MTHSTEPHSITTDVKCCARCGQGHTELIFKPFAKNPIKEEKKDDKGKTVVHIFSHWALCPVLREPLILEIVDDEEYKLAAAVLDDPRR